MTYLNSSEQDGSRRKGFFRGAYYILAGGAAGVAIGGVVAPILGLTLSQSMGFLSAAIGALSVAIIRAFRII